MLFIVNPWSYPIASMFLFFPRYCNKVNTNSCNFTMNLSLADPFPPNKCDDSSLWAPSVSSLRLLLSYSISSTVAFCLSCTRLNPDRHCPSVVMATIWRLSLSVANRCTDIFFVPLYVSLSVWSLCAAVFNPRLLPHSRSHTDGALQQRERSLQTEING